MNHRHRKVLHSLFSHPIPTNVHLGDVETVLKELGADLGHTGHGRMSVALKGQNTTIHGSNHGLSKDEVTSVRKFIEACGISPERDFPL